MRVYLRLSYFKVMTCVDRKQAGLGRVKQAGKAKMLPPPTPHV